MPPDRGPLHRVEPGVHNSGRQALEGELEARAAMRKAGRLNVDQAGVSQPALVREWSHGMPDATHPVNVVRSIVAVAPIEP